MSYPFDQFAALAEAHRHLGMALADVTRVAAQRQFQVATHGLSAITGQGDAGKGVEEFTRVLRETESNRQAWLAQSRAAYDDWHDSVSHVVSVEDAQLYFVNAMQAWARLTPVAAT